MTTEEMYDVLLSRGWHEDYLDEMSPADLTRTYDSGLRGDETEN